MAAHLHATTSSTSLVSTFRVDAFTDQPYSGNPAVVCLLEASHATLLGRQQLQQISAENNQPVTAFVSLCDRSTDFRTEGTFRLSCFSPTTELPLCGHGTLAAAAVLFQETSNQHTTLHFETQKGPVSVTKLDSTAGSLLQIKFQEAKATQKLPADLLLNNTSLQNLVGSMPVQDVLYNDARGVGMVVLAAGTSQAQLEALEPDLELLQSQLGDKHLNGVAVTCQGDGTHHHFLSRYWAPWLGVGEDAVTGSLHTVLTPYWDATLQMGGKPMKARQCSPRGGELQVTYAADEKAVYVAGKAVIMAKGHLLLPDD